VKQFLLILPILLLSVVAHEYAHAWTAFRQGDTTAYDRGRLTFNPLPHIDLFASILLPATLWFVTAATGHPFTFGAARPVPVNPQNYRHYRRGDILVSSAGIAMNLFLALVFAGLYVAVGAAGHALPDAGVFPTLQFIATVGLSLNVLLGLFNLLPLPPLDGSHLLVHVLPAPIAKRYEQFGRFGFLVLLLSFWIVPGVWSVLLAPVDIVTGFAMSALAPWSLGGLR